ncbi:MAG: nucleotidyltransferase family protein [Planctomycetes bacterium]|nr:nucleotidyltransferase family protein [Planctomycetota bacterium]
MAASAPARSVWGLGAARAAPAAQDPALARRLLLAAAPREPTAGLPAAREALDDAAAWEAAAALARRVGQEPIFLRLIDRWCPSAPLLPETRADLEAQSCFHAFRWELIREAVAGLLDGLGRAGVQTVLLKGIALAGEAYDPPGLRPMRDVDVLVRSSDLERARRAALEAGFAEDPARHPNERYAAHHHLAPIFHRATGVCLELHRGLMRLPRRFEGFPAVEELWRGLRPSRVFAGRASLLEPALEVLATCIHITHGDSIGRRAQNLIDLARLVEARGPSLDWGRLAALAAGPDAARSLAVPLAYLEREGLPAAPREVLGELGARSGLRAWELELLFALIDRYRIGSPPPWRFVSGRVSNVLWREALRRGPAIVRAARAAAVVLARR